MNPSAYEWRKTRERMKDARGEAAEAARTRDSELATTRRQCAADRRAMKTRCADQRAKSREKANAVKARSREDSKALRRAHKAGKRAILLSEHNDMVEQNLTPEMLGVWRELSHKFAWRTVTPGDRALQFIEWIEEHPDAITDWQMDNELSDFDHGRAERAHYLAEAVPF